MLQTQQQVPFSLSDIEVDGIKKHLLNVKYIKKNKHSLYNTLIFAKVFCYCYSDLFSTLKHLDESLKNKLENYLYKYNISFTNLNPLLIEMEFNDVLRYEKQVQIATIIKQNYISMLELVKFYIDNFGKSDITPSLIDF